MTDRKHARDHLTSFAARCDSNCSSEFTIKRVSGFVDTDREGKMRHAISLLLPSLAFAGPVKAEARIMAHVTGAFEVVMRLEAQEPGPPGGVPTSRMALSKTFSGGLDGAATGIMIAAGTPKPGAAAAYAAIDQFTGKLEGRPGGFVLVHRGTMSKAGDANLEIVIAPDSGSGELEGITGTLDIRVEAGQHFYDLNYILPER